MSPHVLVLDTASPIVSIALTNGPSRTRTYRTLPLRRSSENLLRTIEEVLEEASSSLRSLDGLVVLRGPGSFTGLRIGLATVLGLHQALKTPATTLDTSAVLASAVAAMREESRGDDAAQDGDETSTVTAAVDALRGDWWTRSYRVGLGGVPQPLGPGGLKTGADWLKPELGVLAGFGVDEMAQEAADALDLAGVERIVPPPLAPYAGALVEDLGPPAGWDSATLTQPIYQRPPAAAAPSSRRVRKS